MPESPAARTKRLARQRTYRSNNADKIATLNAAWRAEHPEQKEYTKEWRARNPNYTKEWNRARREGRIGPFSAADGPDWQVRNRETFLEAKRESTNRRRREIFLEALNHYGGRCYCCGDDEPLCLGLDHINGGGNEHRREIKDRQAIWAKRHGWPALFRVACHSCNLAAHLNGGTCPHQTRTIRIRID